MRKKNLLFSYFAYVLRLESFILIGSLTNFNSRRICFVILFKSYVNSFPSQVQGKKGIGEVYIYVYMEVENQNAPCTCTYTFSVFLQNHSLFDVYSHSLIDIPLHGAVCDVYYNKKCCLLSTKIRESCTRINL